MTAQETRACKSVAKTRNQHPHTLHPYQQLPGQQVEVDIPQGIWAGPVLDPATRSSGKKSEATPYPVVHSKDLLAGANLHRVS